jgi:hypothetical protein
MGVLWLVLSILALAGVGLVLRLITAPPRDGAGQAPDADRTDRPG